MERSLSDDEMARWVTWKQATDRVWSNVVADITVATGLSGADFSVLTRVAEGSVSETPEGSVRQQRLANDLGWERSRLSRHLGRMEARALIVRDGVGAERWISATVSGRAIVGDARVAHADSVRRHLLGNVEEGQSFWDTMRRIADPE